MPGHDDIRTAKRRGDRDRGHGPGSRRRGGLPGWAGQIYQERYWHEPAFETVEAIRKLADQAGVSLVTLAAGWVLANKAITAPIIGASRPDQLDASLAAAEFALDSDLKRQLDELTHTYRLGDAAR